MQSCEAPLRSQVELDCQMIAFELTIEHHLTLTLYAVHLSVHTAKILNMVQMGKLRVYTSRDC